MRDDIAVVGLACRFPGASDATQFWENLDSGVESITFLAEDDLVASGVDAETARRPDYVPAAPLLDDFDRFDAEFFGYSPREASLLDPQQRVFLECAWTAMEHAGHAPGTASGPVGVYGGSAMNTYLLSTGAARRLRDDYLLTLVANDKDYLTTRVSYKLGLTGPSVAVQTACSTSLVAVHVACQSLLDGECDMALAGGVSVRVPHRVGYRHEPGGVLSPDGHCRAFDARAGGTLFGSGAGIVVLRRLADAVADGDTVHAVIKGSAVNNDGSAKVDYMAPSVESQAEVVVEALADAGVDAATVSYLEAHGTGTALGDPVEIAALSRAYRTHTDRTGYCAIGSVKTNVGHLDAAAGIAGLIKTVLALRHRRIPPSLHFDSPNPEIDFSRTPFSVHTRSAAWDAPAPRRAAVNSLGIGGTNAHVILEEAPTPPEPPKPSEAAAPSRPEHLLMLSAATPAALETATRQLAGALNGDADGDAPDDADAPDLADVAYTLRAGRRALPYRRTLVAGDRAEAAAGLPKGRSGHAPSRRRPVVFMFPGGGVDRTPVDEELYATEPVFRESIDAGLAALRRRQDLDLTGVLFGASAADFRRPAVQLPAVFVCEMAMARLWRSWGVVPAAAIGHSMGEIAAACLADVFTFEEALDLVAARGRLVETTSPGATLGVHAPADRVVPLLGSDIDLSGVNTPGTCVVSGPPDAIEKLTAALGAAGIETVPVPIATAAHSRLFDGIVDRFRELVAGARPQAPSTPFISNLTGTWITASQATDPDYWARQLRHTVRFADGARTLLGHPDRLFLDMGPVSMLTAFLRGHPDRGPVHDVIPSARQGEAGGRRGLLDAAGRLWLAGADLDLSALDDASRRRVPLPTYPFQRRRYWISGPPAFADAGEPPAESTEPAEPAEATEPPESAAAAGQAEPAAEPVEPAEREVAAIWRDLLGVEDISVDDDFFDLGGGSLLATQATARINAAFGVELSVLTLVESPTIAEITQRIVTVRRLNAQEVG